MKRLKSLLFLLCPVLAVLPVCSETVRGEPNLAVVPDPPGQVGTFNKHLAIKEKAAQSSPDILFLGDSITEQWASKGKAVWNERFAPLNAFNAGVGGDRTENILWRISDGGIAFKSPPRVCVLMIGTNNTGHRRGAEPPSYTVEGVKKILASLHGEYPQMNILLLGILPRGGERNDRLRLHNDKINDLLAGIRLPYVTYLDVTPSLTDADGKVKAGISPDKLHFNEQGYALYADAILPAVNRLLGREGMNGGTVH